jgi:hypothetical protein
MRAWPRQDAEAVWLCVLSDSSAAGFRQGRNGEQCTGLGDVLGTSAIGEEPVMADAVSACSSNNPSERIRTSEHLIFVLSS